MAGKEFILDPTTIDLDAIVASQDDIRRYNQQRDAMEQLTAIVLDDPERNICVGYRDLASDEFWVAGHMPGMPLMPGVLMCEMAAQVCSYHSGRHDLFGTGVVGFGGLDEVRFRGIVRPGDRLVMVCQMTKIRPRRMVICRFQGFVDSTSVCDGTLRAISLPVDQA